MPTGSFIGVGNFKGLWNATTNSGSNSDLAPPLSSLLANSASVGAGYGLATGLTASVGDYWQVFVGGSTSVDGETSWALNDWCVYQSSSASGMGWNRLSVTDTIAATILGDPSESGLKKVLLLSASAISGPSAMGTPSGQYGEVLFCSSSNATGVDKYFEGNSSFTFDPDGKVLNVTGTLRVNGQIEATQLHTNFVTSSVIFDDGDTRFGNSSDDKHDFIGFITASMGITSSSGISGSYFLGDGSALTGISAGSSLGNSLYVNAASSSVPFWGAADSGGKFGLTGSGRFNFYSGSNSLQVTGNIHATTIYVATNIIHEGDTDTSLSFNPNSLAFEAGGIQSWDANASRILVNADGEPYSFQVGGVTDADTFYVNGADNNVGIRATPTGQQEALLVSGSTMFGSASANMHRFTGSARFSHSIVVGNGSASDGIYHWDDADTNIKFEDDGINFTAGAATLLSLDQGTQDTAIIGATGTDVDFRVITSGENHALFVEGSSNKVSMGYTTPTQAKLSVSGSSQFGRPEGHSDEHWFSGSVFVSDDIHVQDKIYGLGDADTYIGFSTDDKISIAAGGFTMAEFVESATGDDYVELGSDASSGGYNIDVRIATPGEDRTLWVDAGSNNVGIKCAPSGTTQALTVSGSTLFGTDNNDDHHFSGSMFVSQNIAFGGNLHNASDDDTYLDFTDDRIRFYAGNILFADYDEISAQKSTTFNGGNTDIDFLVKSNGSSNTAQTHTVFVEGSSARVGIAESSPQTQLDISGSLRFGRELDTYHMATGSLELTGNIGLNTTASAYSLALPNTDTLMGRGVAYAWSTYSSARYKENVFTMDNPIETAKKLRGVEFTWKESGHKDFGFIAEEVGKVLPQLVSYESDGKSAIGMDYAKITSLLVECVKTQQAQLETQEKRIKTLEKKLKS